MFAPLPIGTSPGVGLRTGAVAGSAPATHEPQMQSAALLRALTLAVALGLSGAAAAKTAAPAAKTAAPAAQAPAASPNETCLMCHADAAAKGAGGKSIAVDTAAFAQSVHGEMQFECTACHRDVSADKLPHAEKLKPADCSGCHDEAVRKFTATAHGRALKEGKAAAASCTDCHGAHDIRRSKDPLSKTAFANIESTCGACHGDDKVVRQANLPGGNVQAKYHDSIHNRLLEGKGVYSTAAPTCTSCHGTHDIQSKNEADSRVARAHIPGTCGSCHQRELTVFGKGRHGALLQSGVTVGPVCSDCHGAHAIQRASTPAWQNAVVGACGNCHDEFITSFRHTYHGKVTDLGFGKVATCASCHGAHDVRPASDPLSRVAPENRLETCRSCHPKAGPQFANWDPHPRPKDREHNPLLYWTNIFMEVLLAGVFLFFGLHTVLWAYRSLRNRLGGKAK